MTVHSGVLQLSTRGDGEIVDLTAGVQSVLSTCDASLGTVTVSAIGSTVAVTTMEYEPGGVEDLTGALERLIPRHPVDDAAGRRVDYAHNRLNHDSNAHAHLRAALLGASETVPLIDGQLALGTWQQLVLIDFDTRPRERRVVVGVLY